MLGLQAVSDYDKSFVPANAFFFFFFFFTIATQKLMCNYDKKLWYGALIKLDPQKYRNVDIKMWVRLTVETASGKRSLVEDNENMKEAV